MTMNQVIHAAVRRDLTRLDRALDAFPSGDAERANQLARAYRFLRHQLTDHHQSEDELIWPVIAGSGSTGRCSTRWSPSTTRCPRRSPRRVPR